MTIWKLASSEDDEARGETKNQIADMDSADVGPVNFVEKVATKPTNMHSCGQRQGRNSDKFRRAGYLVSPDMRKKMRFLMMKANMLMKRSEPGSNCAMGLKRLISGLTSRIVNMTGRYTLSQNSRSEMLQGLSPVGLRFESYSVIFGAQDRQDAIVATVWSCDADGNQKRGGGTTVEGIAAANDNT